jgi:nucleotide-binding universal stress UspA family protein
MSEMSGILVGIDGSNHSERALEWAIKEAALRHAPLRVLAVHTVLKGWTGEGEAFPGDAEETARIRGAAQEATDKVMAGIGGTRPESVTVEAVAGIPAEALVRAAAGADLIVLGSRGAGGFARLALGSVSDQVSRHAKVPVVIVPSGEER